MVRGMGSTGNGFGRGNGGAGEGKGYGAGGLASDVSTALDADRMGPTGTGRGTGGSVGTEGVGGDDADIALSGPGGAGKNGGAKGGMGGARIGYGSDGYDSNLEAYTEQAVELTERRTVLIRTVKNEDDVLEMDHQEQTYTITGAADDSDAE
ncbi:unnamed protein product [Menidia menidia]|uniref:(Atlantic silverside) hypothetical protein n=1 Tax=Menidia menidia TaxID=238744 RepID=A0A8S4BVR8_9TELE|nr:unnamed protein product [Menidia menidia]